MTKYSIAQNDCVFKLDEAQNSYEEGVFQSIPDLLLPCMERGFNKDEKLRAYKLLILTYLFDDQQDKAEELMLEFLGKYPEYQITAADPVEFQHLFEDYQTIPVYSFGITLGGNFTDAMFIQSFGVGNLNDYDADYKPSGLGFQVGFRVNRYLMERMEISAELTFTQNKTQYSSSLYNFTSISKTETSSSLSLPLSVTYDFPFRLVTPYVRGGISMDYLVSSSALFNRTYSENIGLTEVTGPEIDLTPNRKQFYTSFLLGGGVKYNLSNGYLVLDLRTNLGLYNFVNEDNRYAIDSHELIYKYYYVDDDFILNRLYFSVGYVRKLYKTYPK
jgi:opacity protein-like surface antigen